MKDITFPNGMQEKKQQNIQKMFLLGEALSRRQLPGQRCALRPVRSFQQSGILRSMPVPVCALEPVHARVRAAILHRRPIAALYRGAQTSALSAPAGLEQTASLQVLCYQYGGHSESGLMSTGSSDNWRCLAVDNLSHVELLHDSWQAAENRSRPQNCIEKVELDADACPTPIPPAATPKSAKL